MSQEKNKNKKISPNINNAVISRKAYSERQRVLKVFLGRKLAVVGLILIIILILTALFADLLAPYDPNQIDFSVKLQSPSAQHLLGTDSVGRDILSRIIYGSRTSLLVALGAIGIASVFGQTLGLIAGYFGGLTYTVIMRLIDALMAVPMLLIALVIASVLGGGIPNVIIALGISMTSGQCRMMCAQVMTVKQNDYILAGKALGIKDIPMMLSEIFPNAFPPLLVMITIGLGTAILAEAGLSFLGIGIVPPTPAWGSMVSEGYKFLLTNPIISFAPGFAIMLTVFGFNMLGDGLRDALDPRLRGVI